MSAEEKTFKVICAHAECQKPFHMRFPLAQPNATGTGEVVVTCMYCGKNVMVTIPTVYIQEDSLVRGLKSLPAV
jgi:hypothetical protein